MINQKGFKSFTKSEVIISFLLILISSAIIWMAIDPLTGVAKERDNIRRSQAVALLNAALQYQVDNEGALPPGVDFDASTSQVLGTSTEGCDLTCGAVMTARSCVDLRDSLHGDYIDTIYADPKYGTEENTDYYINRTQAGRVVVGVCDPEVSQAISVVR